MSAGWFPAGLMAAALLGASGAAHAQAAAPATAPADDPTGLAEARETAQGRIVLAYLDALNARDLPAVRGLLAADFDMPRRWRECPVQESDADCFIRYLNDRTVSLDGTAALQKIRVEWHIVRINIALSNRSTAEEGVARLLLTDEFLVEDGKIASFIRTPRTEDLETRRYFQNRWEER